MAYVQPIQQKQLEDLTQTGSGTVTTQPGSTTETAPLANTNASNLTQQTSTPGTSPSQFVNFQDLVDANQTATNQYAQNVGNLIGYDDTSNTLGTNTASANDQVNAGYHDVGSDVISRALANPNDTNFEGFDTLKSILGGYGYSGPNTASDIYTGAKQAVDTLGDKSNSLTDPTALSTYILQHPNAGTTAGGAQLDAALLTGTQGSQEQIANVQQQVGDLQKQYDANVASTQSAIDAKKTQATARKDEILGQASGTLDSIRNQAQSQADAQNAAEQARIAAAQNAARNGDFATLSSLIPGLDAGSLSNVLSQLSDKGGDFSKYLTVGGPSYTAGNFVSPDQLSQYNGIRDLFGVNASSIAGAGKGATTAFNTSGALGELQSRLTAQRAAEAAAAAEAQRQAEAEAQRAAAAQQAALAAAMANMYYGTSTPSALYGGSSLEPGGPGTAGTGGAGSTATGQTSPNAAASAVGTVASNAIGVPGLSIGLTAANNGLNGIASSNAAANAAAMDATMDAAAAPDATAASVGAAAAAAAAAAGNSGAAASVGNGTTGSPGGNTGAEGDASGGSGGGGGGGKIICTAMNDLYGLPYRENKIWTKYAKTHLTPEHQIGYHKVFLPLVDYGFKQGDGLGNRLVRAVLIWIGKNRTADIINELEGKPRNPVHRFLRAVAEPTLAAIGKWSKRK